MNSAMIKEFLARKYPNTYSLLRETEIKQHIYAFVQNNRKGKFDKIQKSLMSSRLAQYPQRSSAK